MRPPLNCRTRYALVRDLSYERVFYTVFIYLSLTISRHNLCHVESCLQSTHYAQGKFLQHLTQCARFNISTRAQVAAYCIVLSSSLLFERNRKVNLESNSRG